MRLLNAKYTKYLRLILAIVFGLALNHQAIAEQGKAEQGKIVITIQNSEPLEGDLAIGVYDSAENWLEEGDEYQRVLIESPPDNPTHTFVVEAGVYAVAVRVDENGNGELDYNFFGVPTEPFGISNNPDTFFEPEFTDAEFTVGANATKYLAIELEF